MDGRRTGSPKGAREQNPAYRPTRPPQPCGWDNCERRGGDNCQMSSRSMFAFVGGLLLFMGVVGAFPQVGAGAPAKTACGSPFSSGPVPVVCGSLRSEMRVLVLSLFGLAAVVLVGCAV